MCIRRFVIGLAVCCLLGLAGCEVLDRAATGLDRAGKAAHQAANDPQAPLSSDMRTVLEGVGLGAAGLVGLYQSIRYGKLWKTSRAMVQGVEDTPSDQAAPVKVSIERRMVKAGNFERLNAVVDKLKGV